MNDLATPFLITYLGEQLGPDVAVLELTETTTFPPAAVEAAEVHQHIHTTTCTCTCTCTGTGTDVCTIASDAAKSSRVSAGGLVLVPDQVPGCDPRPLHARATRHPARTVQDEGDHQAHRRYSQPRYVYISLSTVIRLPPAVSSLSRRGTRAAPGG
jgi:hypothetical protein